MCALLVGLVVGYAGGLYSSREIISSVQFTSVQSGSINDVNGGESTAATATATDAASSSRRAGAASPRVVEPGGAALTEPAAAPRGWRHSMGCTASQAEANAASFFQAGGFKATRCPGSQPLEAYRQQMAAELDDPFNVLVVGCNTGSDAIAMARLFSQNRAFNYSSFLRYTKFPCGACSMCTDDGPIYPPGTVSKIAKVATHCFEALPTNFRTLTKGAEHFGYGNMGFHVVEAAVTGKGGPASVSFPKDSKVGKESIGIGNKVRGAGATVMVPTQTVDNYARKNGLLSNFDVEKVDVLLIDTEGHDAKVLEGAKLTLESGSVRYLEFEYHAIGHWKNYQLEKTIDYLDKLEYQCFWIGKAQVW
eukprot:CAMPEP_0197604610 /NCGR_PEP_ID=MMETSP1326-20131121/41529_1 /TAXON_ID=1155430 /ORGANISM="Genus nov. species nov., Strain RCC2288" /LENGTH=363 /DNA_ID=CAMNT_0043172305 /DNA_START=32 /DNA_END=1120 /DNA_ORIENTATION=+